jgi:ADP-ribosylglycohydrolase
MNTIWLTLSETVLIELEQSADEGRDVRGFADEACQILEAQRAGQLREEDAKILIDKMRSAPIAKDYPYHEPASLEEIRKARPGNRNSGKAKPDKGALYDKIYGAWLGRCAGCLLGKPIEGWRRDRITGLLKETGNYPVNYYISSDIDANIKTRYSIIDDKQSHGGCWINNVSCMPEDDDTNYTILYLKTIENWGRNFTSDNTIESWLLNVPIFHVCTAERVAYHNFVNLIPPPLSGSYYNAYREWIGAQIRADFFGYVSPGDTEQAAEYAWRDARISHTKNGIYGEMFCAAMIARAAVSSDIKDIIISALGEIPEKSRLYEGIKKVIGWHEKGASWEAALDNIHAIYDEANGHHWCHTISNAMVCAAALLWGNGDFEKTVGISICAGFDTDCNGATTGSIIGMMSGAGKIPEKWKNPLNNKVKSGIDGFSLTEISELAERTIKLID